MEGKWTTPNLTDVVRIFAGNRHMSQDVDGGITNFLRPLLRLGHWLRRNSRSGSRRNIHAHYDLGNEFFELFLAPARCTRPRYSNRKAPPWNRRPSQNST